MTKRYALPKGRLASLVRDHPAQTAAGGVDVVECIQRGFGWSEVRPYQEAFQIKDAAFARLLGVSDRTLARIKRRSTHLDSVASDRFYRTLRVLSQAGRFFQSAERAAHWLQREQPGLGGKVPLSLMDTEPGTQAVETLLGQLEYGILP